MAKFKKGDKVVLTKRAPVYIRETLQPGRKRTITGCYYNKEGKHSGYRVGTNRIGKAGDIVESYHFRSYQLKLAPNYKKAGKPKTTRKYRRRR
jgi:hypothetical protein